MSVAIFVADDLIETATVRREMGLCRPKLDKGRAKKYHMASLTPGWTPAFRSPFQYLCFTRGSKNESLPN